MAWGNPLRVWQLLFSYCIGNMMRLMQLSIYHVIFGTNKFCGYFRCIWHRASSTGLNAVSKGLSAPPTCEMGCRYSLQSCQSNGKSNFKNELTNQKFDSNRNSIKLKDNIAMWSPSSFLISNGFCRMENNFGPLTSHIITEFSWVVTMAPTVPSTDILRWPVTSR